MKSGPTDWLLANNNPSDYYFTLKRILRLSEQHKDVPQAPRPCVTFLDSRFDYGEVRLITLGLLAGRVVIIAHTPRGENTTRILSMRRANRREQKNLSKATWQELAE
jgi:uncharacterized DUF497 family protein